MGRREKAVQPNDQARKEAKKRELKKNKKQRQLVRELVAQQRDPKKLHLELEALKEREAECETQFARLPWIEKQAKVQAQIREVCEYFEKNDPEKLKDYKRWKVRFFVGTPLLPPPLPLSRGHQALPHSNGGFWRDQAILGLGPLCLNN